MITDTMPINWLNFIQPDQYLDKEVLARLSEYVEKEYKNSTCYPEKSDIYAALSLTAPEEVKVVILGQDPYHGPEQAMGLSFSVPEGIALPPSLKNIFKELESDLATTAPTSGDLTSWAKQGVLLLNTVLSVRCADPGSHQKKGWEQLTDLIVEKIAASSQPTVFVLWGKKAQEKELLIEKHQSNLIIKSAHPSPLGAYRGFFGSKPFSRVNAYLKLHGLSKILWNCEVSDRQQPMPKGKGLSRRA